MMHFFLILILKSLNIYSWCIIVYILMHMFATFFVEIRSIPILFYLLSFLHEVVEPFLQIFRRIIPPIGGVCDISPMLAIWVLYALKSLLIQIILSL